MIARWLRTLRRPREAEYVQQLDRWQNSKPVGGETRPGHHVTPLALPEIRKMKAETDRKLRRVGATRAI